MPGDPKPARRKPAATSRPATRKRKGSKKTARKAKKPSSAVTSCPPPPDPGGLQSIQEQAVYRVLEEFASPIEVAKEFKVQTRTVRDWVRKMVAGDALMGIHDDSEIRAARLRIRSGIERMMAFYAPIAVGEKDDIEIRMMGDNAVAVGTEKKEAAQIAIKLMDLYAKVEAVIKPTTQSITKLTQVNNNTYNQGPMTHAEIVAQSNKALPELLASMAHIQIVEPAKEAA